MRTPCTGLRSVAMGPANHVSALPGLGYDMQVKIADFGEEFLWTGVPATIRLKVPVSPRWRCYS